MEWYPSYEIGIWHIDNQHKELVDIVSSLQQSLLRDGKPGALAKAIRFLVEYTQKHFHDEEQLMEEIKFYDLENHKKLHKKLIDEVREVLLDLKKGKSVDPNKLVDFLTDWLLTHIKQEDKKIARAIETTK